MKSKIFICFVTALVFFGLLASIGNIDSKTVETKQSEGPRINFVNMTHPYEQHIDNNSIVYICETFNITINVTDKNKLSTMVITYDGNEIVHDLGGEYQVEIEQPISISDPGIYEVSIMVNNTAGYETWYFFTVICCDDRPPLINVYDEHDELLTPEWPVYTCKNTTVKVEVGSADGIDVVVITIKRDGSVIWSEINDLSNDGVDTYFSEAVTIPITTPGTYQLEIYASDLCQYDTSRTYLFVCKGQDKPPEILGVKACGKEFVGFNECVCCCNFTIVIYAYDDCGISQVDIYIDDVIDHSELFTPPLTFLSYEHEVMIPYGMHQLKIVVSDTSGYTDMFMFYALCDFAPPTIDVYMDGSAVENGSVVSPSDDIVSITATGMDDVAMGRVEIYAQSILIEEREYDCPLITRGYNITVDLNFTEYMFVRGIQFRDRLIIWGVVWIKIVVYDFCGNRAVFSFRIIKTLEVRITPRPVEVILTPAGAGLVIGLGFASSVLTLVAFNFIKRKGAP